MIPLRRSRERGRTKLNRLDSRHTFSFGDYYDPQHMVFRELRVVKEIEDALLNHEIAPRHESFGTPVPLEAWNCSTRYLREL